MCFVFLTWVGFCQRFCPWHRLEGRYEEQEEESQVPFRHPASIQLGLAVLVGPKILPYVDELDHEKEFLRTGPHDSAEGKHAKLSGFITICFTEADNHEAECAAICACTRLYDNP